MAKKSDSLNDLLSKFAVNQEVVMQKLLVDALNEIWGGGMAKGYMYSFWAEPGVGKSTLSLQIAKSFCKDSKRVLIVDGEKAVNAFMIDSFGLRDYVDNGTLIITTVTNFAEWEELCMGVSETGEFDLIITDSVTTISPITPKGLTVVDVRPGLRAQQESFVLNKLKDQFYKKGVTSLMIFHARANINIMGGGTQALTKQAGGFAAEHYPDVITKITSHGKVKDEDDVIIGCEITLVSTKNKFTAPFRPLRKKLIYGVGISKRIDLVDTAIEKGVVVQKGPFFTLPWVS